MHIKKYVTLAISVLVIIVIGVLLLFKNNYITGANRHINVEGLELKAREENLKGTLEQDFTQLYGMGCKGYSSPKKGIEIWFSGFPDVGDKWVLTNIQITNPYYSIYNMHVGDKVNEAVQILTENGFTAVEDMKHTYRKKSIQIRLFINDESEIEKVGIGLKSTNKRGIVF